MNNSQIFIHLGLPKTATTYLQEYIFKQFNRNDISFLGKAKCVSIWDIMDMPSNKYLISSENLLADPFNCEKGKWLIDFKKNLLKLHYKFPKAKYILTIRNQEDLILSLYKEFIKKGNRSHYPKINEFYDIDQNKGQISQDDFFYKNIIEKIIEVTNTKPLVLTQEEIKNNISFVIKKFEVFLNIPQQKIINYDKKTNVGANYYQTKLLFKINQFAHRTGINLYTPFLKKRGLTPDYIIRVFGNKISWLPKKKLEFSKEMEQFIKKKYKEDLEWTNKFIKNQNKYFVT